METVRVVTREEEAAGAVFVLVLAAAALALLLPSVLLPLSVSVGIGFHAHAVWNWHPLFSILLGLFAAAIFAVLVGASIALLPRIVWTAMASVYLGAMYYFAAHAPHMLVPGWGVSDNWSLDNIWSAAIALTAAAIGGFLAWRVKEEIE